MKRCLIPTELASLLLTREGATEKQARNAIKRWSSAGTITNYGGTRRGQARWDPKEIKAALRLQSR